MIVPADFEIIVAVEIIGQETHADFKGDEFSGKGQKLDFLFRQTSMRSFQKSPDQRTENFDSDAHFGKISLLNQDLLNGSMKCTILFEVFNHNQRSRDFYCGHASISASHFATIQNGSHFSIDYVDEMVSKWRTDSCRIINGNSDLIRSFKDMVDSKINSIAGSSYIPENIETISTDKKANMLLSSFYDNKRNPYHCKSGYKSIDL